MTFNRHPYQKCLENDLSEDQMEGFQTGEDTEIFDRPKDSYYFTHVAFYILGITSIMPQNFFIVANEVNYIFIVLLLLYHFIVVLDVQI